MDLKVIKVLELYSGIGGFHYAVKDMKNIEVCVAMDINPFANETYKHNFPNVKVLQRNIESLKAKEVEEFDVDMIWMSPPCQPFTRAEYVLGWESSWGILINAPNHSFSYSTKFQSKNSDTRRKLVEIIKDLNYVFQEFLLSPVQLGIPNSRLRYYMVAKLKPLTFSFQTTEEVMTSLPSIRTSSSPQNLNKYLEDEPESYFFNHFVPDKVLLKYTNLLDVVDRTSTKSCCFTKGYSHMVEGSGSVLQINLQINTDETYRKACAIDDANEKLNLLRSLKLRYFTSREVANLMGFPSHFEFPQHFPPIQKYRLLGNSLNVDLVEQLVHLCFS